MQQVCQIQSKGSALDQRQVLPFPGEDAGREAGINLISPHLPLSLSRDQCSPLWGCSPFPSLLLLRGAALYLSLSQLGTAALQAGLSPVAQIIPG